MIPIGLELEWSVSRGIQNIVVVLGPGRVMEDDYGDLSENYPPQTLKELYYPYVLRDTKLTINELNYVL